MRWLTIIEHRRNGERWKVIIKQPSWAQLSGIFSSWVPQLQAFAPSFPTRSFPSVLYFTKTPYPSLLITRQETMDNPVPVGSMRFPCGLVNVHTGVHHDTVMVAGSRCTTCQVCTPASCPPHQRSCILFCSARGAVEYRQQVNKLEELAESWGMLVDREFFDVHRWIKNHAAL